MFLRCDLFRLIFASVVLVLDRDQSLFDFVVDNRFFLSQLASESCRAPSQFVAGLQSCGFISGNGLLLGGVPLLESAESVGFAVLFDCRKLVSELLFDVRVLVTLLANQS